MGTAGDGKPINVGSCDAASSLVTKGTFEVGMQPSGGVGVPPPPTSSTQHDTPNARRDIVAESEIMAQGACIFKSEASSFSVWDDPTFAHRVKQTAERIE